MHPRRWQRVKELFLATIELTERARTRVLRRECADDDELMGEVEALLNRQHETREFLEKPPHLSGDPGKPDESTPVAEWDRLR